jgi:hypothetical protein
MQSPQFTPTIGTTQPDPNLTIKIYDAVNNGSFAIILVAVGGLIYLKRSAREFLQSPFANSLLSLIKQIETNQEHIENIALDVDRLDKSTNDMLDLVSNLQQEILRAGELSTAQHTMIMKELRNVRIILERRGAKNVDNH